MLYYQAVDTATLELLKRLLAQEVFSEMRLAGGTALALQYGHRKSIDIDLFGKVTTDSLEIVAVLGTIGEVHLLQNTKNIKSYSVNNIKVDIVNYPYPWISPLLIEGELRLADQKDIAAMKLAAITGRGSKKDFFDLYFLLKHFTLGELVACYTLKYADGSTFLVLKSITYFEDAEEDADPVLLIPLTWAEVKNAIKAESQRYLDSLS